MLSWLHHLRIMNYTNLLFVALAMVFSTMVSGQSKTVRLHELLKSNTSTHLTLDEEHFLKGYALYANGEDLKALTHFKEALQIDAEQPAYLFYAGHSQYYLGQAKQGIALIEKSVALEHNPKFVQQLADLYIEYGALDKAYTLHEKSISLGVDNASTLAYMAEILSFMNKPTDAIRMYQLALEDLEFYGDAQATCLYNIANLYFNLENYKASSQWFYKYLNVRPLDIDAISLLIQANNKIGQSNANQNLHNRISLAQSLALLPDDMVMYCVDKFHIDTMELVAFKSLSMEVGQHPIDFIFYISTPEKQPIATLQTEYYHTKPEPASYVLTSTDAAGYKTYPVVFPKKIEYAELKATLAKLLEQGEVSF